MPFSIAQQTSVTAPASTSHSVALPAFVKGNRLILVASIDGASVTFTAGLTGWTTVLTDNRIVVHTKIADGTETTLALTSSASGEMVAVVYAIEGSHPVTAVEGAVTTHIAGAGTTYPFPNLAISGWADEETLFISGCGYDRSSEFTITGSPSTDHTELTANFDSSNLTVGEGMATQYRIATLNALQPSAWTGSSTRAASEFVIAIRPSPVSVARTLSGSTALTHNLNLPKLIQLGDPLIAVVRLTGGNATTFTLGTGWTAVAINSIKKYYTKIADAADVAAAGGTVTLTLATTSFVAADIYAVHGGVAIDVGAHAAATDNTVEWNPVTVSGGSQNVCIIAALWGLSDEASGVPVVSFGSDAWMETFNTAAAASGAPVVASAYLVSTVSSYDPTTFTLTGASSGRAWGSTVFAVRYAGGAPVVISDAGDESYTSGEAGVVITGTGFGITQGVGTVLISPTDDVTNVAAVAQTVTSWSDTAITFTAVQGALTLGATAYLFVKENAGLSNTSGWPVSFVTRGAARRMLLGIG